MTVRNEEANTNTENGQAFQRQEKTMYELIRGSMCVIRYTVNGFWSSDPLSIYVERAFKRSETNYKDVSFFWKLSISWVSGGRDPKTVPSDIEASKNFAAALTDATQYSEYLEKNQYLLEAAYNEYLEEEERKAAKQKADEEARREADEPMGDDVAKLMLDTVLKTPSFETLKCKFRGVERYCVFKFTRTSTGRLRIENTQTYGRIDQKTFVEILSDMSSSVVVFNE